MKALKDACSESDADGWASPAPDGAWYAKAVQEGVSQSDNKDNRRQTFIRTVNLLLKSGHIERDIISGKCRPMAPDDEKLPSDDDGGDKAATTAKN
jgi:hypothetical protein